MEVRPARAAAVQPLPNAVAAAAALQATSRRSWSIRWNAHSGLPRTLAGGRAAGYQGTPDAVALEFVHDHAELFGAVKGRAAEPVDFTAIQKKRVPGGTVVILQQTAGGLPIVDAQIRILVSDNAAVAHVASSATALQALPLLQPSLTSDDAVHSGLADLGWSAQQIRLDQPACLVIFSDTKARLAYEVFLTVTLDYPEPWRLVIDAQTGHVLRSQRLIAEATGTGTVFDPNPVATLADPTLLDHGDSNFAVPAAAYRTVTLAHLDEPVGGVYQLSGAYVRLANIDIPTNIPPTSTTGTFNYLRSSNAFEEVMVYYTLDRSQSYIQSLGFDDVNNRVQIVDAHGLFSMDLSAFQADTGGTGRIQYGDGGVDDAEDADIILHEYGHAIQHNSAPWVYMGNADNGYGNETRAMGEGFGDYWAASSGYDSSVAHGFPPEFVGEWDARGYASGPAYYLRVVNSDKVYPRDMTGSIHTDGEIWSSALWEIFGDVGRGTADRIVLLSHFLVGTNPDFADGGYALFDADALLYPTQAAPGTPLVGEHYNAICQALDRRGILTCSSVCACPNQGTPIVDGHDDVVDLLYVIDEVFFGSPALADPLCPSSTRSDYNCDSQVDAVDITLAVDYVILGGAPPCDPCAP